MIPSKNKNKKGTKHKFWGTECGVGCPSLLHKRGIVFFSMYPQVWTANRGLGEELNQGPMDKDILRYKP